MPLPTSPQPCSSRASCLAAVPRVAAVPACRCAGLRRLRRNHSVLQPSSVSTLRAWGQGEARGERIARNVVANSIAMDMRFDHLIVKDKVRRPPPLLPPSPPLPVRPLHACPASACQPRCPASASPCCSVSSPPPPPPPHAATAEAAPRPPAAARGVVQARRPAAAALPAAPAGHNQNGRRCAARAQRAGAAGQGLMRSEQPATTAANLPAGSLRPRPRCPAAASMRNLGGGNISKGARVMLQAKTGLASEDPKAGSVLRRLPGSPLCLRHVCRSTAPWPVPALTAPCPPLNTVSPRHPRHAGLLSHRDRQPEGAQARRPARQPGLAL